MTDPRGEAEQLIEAFNRALWEYWRWHAPAEEVTQARAALLGAFVQSATPASASEVADLSKIAGTPVDVHKLPGSEKRDMTLPAATLPPEAVERDAERYRWLRDLALAWQWKDLAKFAYEETPKAVDDAIDSFRSRSSSEPSSSQ